MDVRVLMYHHHDYRILNNVIDALIFRGHRVYLESEYENTCNVLLLAADFNNPAHQKGIDACARFRYAGRHSFGIQHGIPIDKSPFELMSDHHFFWGEEWTKHYKSRDPIIVGNPRMDGYDCVKILPRYGLIVPCARQLDSPGVPQNAEDRIEFYVNAIKKTQELHKASGLDWIVRVHPSDIADNSARSFYRTIADKTQSSVQFPWQMNLYDLLVDTQVVIGTSSVVAEAEQFYCDTIPLFMPYYDETLPLETKFKTARGSVADKIVRHMENIVH